MQWSRKEATRFPLYLRIPGWCRQAADRGQRHAVCRGARTSKGFAKIPRTWAKGDVVELQLPMEPRVVRGFETEFPAANRNYFNFEPAVAFPAAAIALCERSPMVRCCSPCRSPTWIRTRPFKDANWQYALDTDAGQRDGGITVTRQPMPAHWDWPLDAPARVDRAGPGVRLEADRRPGVARQAGDGNRVRNRSGWSLTAARSSASRCSP